MTSVRFHGLLLVRDEDDVIEEMVHHTFRWIDKLFVLDTGSSDDTYAILEDLRKDYANLVLLGRHTLRFDESLRAYMFNEIRHQFSDGDWIAKLDADEFYHVHPPQFIRSFVKPQEGAVDLVWYYFRLTSEEAEEYETGRRDLLSERKLSVSDRRRYYKITKHREPRLFRYRKSMKFSHTNNAPTFAGLKSPLPIPIRHYPHRDPQQMRKRFKLRSMMKAAGSQSGEHWSSDDWKKDLVSLADSETETGGLATQIGHTDGPLMRWRDGTTLPNIVERQVMPGRLSKLGKRIFYAAPVALADKFVAGFDSPQFLDERRMRDFNF